MTDNGIIDRVNFRVFLQAPDSTARSGLGFQLTDQAGGREYVGIRSMDTSVLGGLPSSEGLPGTESNDLLSGAGTLSQIRRGGAFHLEGDRDQIRQAIAVIDRAIEQTIREQAHVGTYQNATLDRNAEYISSLQEELSNSVSDIASTDVAADAAALASTQLRVQAVTSVLAQANQLPQTLLQLLG
jgi:flagellin